MMTVNMEIFVLSSERHMLNGCYYWDGYYTGKEIKLRDGKIFAICSKQDEDATVYISRKEAEKAADVINNRVCNYKFKTTSIKYVIGDEVSTSMGGNE